MPDVDGMTYAGAFPNRSGCGPGSALASTAARQPSRPTQQTALGWSHSTSRRTRSASALYSARLSSRELTVGRLTRSVMPTLYRVRVSHGFFGWEVTPAAAAAFQNRLLPRA